MNVFQLCTDYHIPTRTEGKNCAPGWVNLCCPTCNDTGFHLGYNLANNYTHCWRCGWQPLTTVFSGILHISERDTYFVLKQYGNDEAPRQIEVKKPVGIKPHRLPSNVQPLDPIYKEYLISRNFDPDKLEKEWKLLATGPISILDNIDFCYRILAPIIWDNVEVSFQTRDISGVHQLRYITCPKDRELIEHKAILYGNQEKWKNTGICVEGITKVWRLGPYSFATFGIEFTIAQVRIMAKFFKRVAVVFDGNEAAAKKQANKLVGMLKFRNVDAWRVDIDGDPGDMPQDEADYLVKTIMK